LGKALIVALPMRSVKAIEIEKNLMKVTRELGWAKKDGEGQGLASTEVYCLSSIHPILASKMPIYALNWIINAVCSDQIQNNCTPNQQFTGHFSVYVRSDSLVRAASAAYLKRGHSFSHALVA
jgi:hypothetical protein